MGVALEGADGEMGEVKSVMVSFPFLCGCWFLGLYFYFPSIV